jgi:hypothetical protein
MDSVHHPSLALAESYDIEIAPLLTTIDQSKSSLKTKNPFAYFVYSQSEIELLILIQQLIYQPLL